MQAQSIPKNATPRRRQRAQISCTECRRRKQKVWKFPPCEVVLTILSVIQGRTDRVEIAFAVILPLSAMSNQTPEVQNKHQVKIQLRWIPAWAINCLQFLSMKRFKATYRSENIMFRFSHLMLGVMSFIPRRLLLSIKRKETPMTSIRVSSISLLLLHMSI